MSEILRQAAVPYFHPLISHIISSLSHTPQPDEEQREKHEEVEPPINELIDDPVIDEVYEYLPNTAKQLLWIKLPKHLKTAFEPLIEKYTKSPTVEKVITLMIIDQRILSEGWVRTRLAALGMAVDQANCLLSFTMKPRTGNFRPGPSSELCKSGSKSRPRKWRSETHL